MAIVMVGIDLAKNAFALHSVSASGMRSFAGRRSRAPRSTRPCRRTPSAAAGQPGVRPKAHRMGGRLGAFRERRLMAGSATSARLPIAAVHGDSPRRLRSPPSRASDLPVGRQLTASAARKRRQALCSEGPTGSATGNRSCRDGPSIAPSMTNRPKGLLTWSDPSALTGSGPRRPTCPLRVDALSESN